MRSAAGAPLPLIAIRETWQHAATTGHPGWALRITPQGLTSGAAYAPTRFNPGNLMAPGFETLYLALDQQTALLEKRAMFGYPYGSPPVLFPGPKMTRTQAISVDVDLRAVADLTDLGTHALLDTNAQELTGDWAGYQQRSLPGPLVTLRSPVGIAPTQTLGWELFHEPGIEGIKAISAKAPTTCCLVIFTHKLQRPSSLAWGDPNTGRRESYP